MPIYNVRDTLYDPRNATTVAPHCFAHEPSFLLASRKLLQTRGGALARLLATQVLDEAPAHEHDRMKFTVRVEELQPGAFPLDTPKSWHTDYAHGLNNDRRLQVHNYVLITSAPRTVFLRESNVWLPDVRDQAFCRELDRTQLTQLEVEPWCFVRFNATELHTATKYTGAVPTTRLFFRATYDPVRS